MWNRKGRKEGEIPLFSRPVFSRESFQEGKEFLGRGDRPIRVLFAIKMDFPLSS
jgi:hypothetical protein